MASEWNYKKKKSSFVVNFSEILIKEKENKFESAGNSSYASSSSNQSRPMVNTWIK